MEDSFNREKFMSMPLTDEQRKTFQRLNTNPDMARVCPDLFDALKEKISFAAMASVATTMAAVSKESNDAAKTPTPSPSPTSTASAQQSQPVKQQQQPSGYSYSDVAAHKRAPFALPLLDLLTTSLKSFAAFHSYISTYGSTAMLKGLNSRLFTPPSVSAPPNSLGSIVKKDVVKKALELEAPLIKFLDTLVSASASSANDGGGDDAFDKFKGGAHAALDVLLPLLFEHRKDLADVSSIARHSVAHPSLFFYSYPLQSSQVAETLEPQQQPQQHQQQPKQQKPVVKKVAAPNVEERKVEQKVVKKAVEKMEEKPVVKKAPAMASKAKKVVETKKAKVVVSKKRERAEGEDDGDSDSGDASNFVASASDWAAHHRKRFPELYNPDGTRKKRVREPTPEYHGEDSE